MTIHELKTHPEPFEAVRLWRKRFEMRSTADRTFAVGDYLRLREWDPEMGDYTGRSLSVSVLYILPSGAYGVPEGYCVMSIVVVG